MMGISVRKYSSFRPWRKPPGAPWHVWDRLQNGFMEEKQQTGGIHETYRIDPHGKERGGKL